MERVEAWEYEFVWRRVLVVDVLILGCFGGVLLYLGLYNNIEMDYSQW